MTVLILHTYTSHNYADICRTEINLNKCLNKTLIIKIKDGIV